MTEWIVGALLVACIGMAGAITALWARIERQDDAIADLHVTLRTLAKFYELVAAEHRRVPTTDD